MRARLMLVLVTAIGLAGYLATTTAAPVRTRQVPPAGGTGVVEGTVSDDIGQPLAGAYVAIYGADLGGTRAVLTGEDGRFRIQGLPSGQFMLAASKPAYATVEYGQRRPGGEGTPIHLDAGARRAVAVQLSRTGSIAGTLADSSGNAISGSVTLYRVTGSTPRGGRELARFRGYGAPGGAYRAENVPPGDYIVLGGETFFPAARRAADARVVSVSAAQDVRGIDIRFLPPLETTRIDGTLVAPASNLTLTNATVWLYSDDAELPGVNARVVSVSNRTDFSIPAVAPGRYTLVARANLRDGPQRPIGPGVLPPAAWAVQPVEVSSAAPVVVSLALEPTMTITGRFVVDATALRRAPDLTSVGVTVVPIGMPAAFARSLPGNVIDRTTANGTFTVSAVPAGRFVLRVSAREAGWFAKSVQAGETNVTDLPIDVTSGRDLAGLVITISDRTNVLGGRVTAPAGSPLADTVVIFPSDERYWRPATPRIQAAPVALGGRYEVRGLPQGDYLIAAARLDASNSLTDPTWLKGLTTGAAAVSLGDGERKTVDLGVAGARTVASVVSSTPFSRAADASAPGGPPIGAAPPTSTARVSGTVNTEDGKPIAGVTVVLFSADDGAVARRDSSPIQTARTTAGAFTIAMVPPGKYRLAVVDDAAIGAAPTPELLVRVAPRTLPLDLAAQEQATINLTVEAGPERRILSGQRSRTMTVPTISTPRVIPPGGPPGGSPLPPPTTARAPGSISGIVTDASGRPVAGVPVQVLRRLTRDNVPQLAPFGQPATTDANGFYHLTNVAAGSAFVAAVAYPINTAAPGGATVSALPHSTTGADGGKLAYVTTFFPGVTGQARARAVLVGTEEIARIDFSLSQVPAIDLSGVITGLDPNLRGSPPIFLLPAAILDHLGGRNVQRAAMAAGGQFTFTNVAFGNYVITVNGPGGWARQPVSITGPLAQPLSLPLSPYLTVSGRLEFKGERAGASATELTQFDIRLNTEPLVSGSPLLRAQVSPTGEFTIARVPGGRYSLRAASPAPWIEIAGVINGRDTLDAPVDLTANATDATIVFADRDTSVVGTVRDAAGAPVADVAVLIFSSDAQFWTAASRRVRVLRTSPTGRFSVPGLPSGQYFAIARRQGPPGAQPLGPDVLRPLAERAQRFDLLQGQSRTLDLILQAGLTVIAAGLQTFNK